MKTFEATYKKQFKSETKDALYIAALHQPKGTECVNVEEIEELPERIDLFELLSETFKPNK